MPRLLTLSLLTLLAAGVPLASWADCMGPYPPSMVKAFTAVCAKDQNMLSYCGCVMDEVQKNIPLADFIEIGNSAGGINGDSRFIGASKKCSTKLPDASGVSSAPAPATPAAASPVPPTPVSVSQPTPAPATTR